MNKIIFCVPCNKLNVETPEIKMNCFIKFCNNFKSTIVGMYDEATTKDNYWGAVPFETRLNELKEENRKRQRKNNHRE